MEERKKRPSSITGPREKKVVKHKMPGAEHKRPGAKPVYKERLAKPEPDDMPHKPRSRKYKHLKGVLV